MELSKAFFSGKLKFETIIEGDQKKYLPFQSVVMKAFPGRKTADRFPVAFGCPLFTGGIDQEPLMRYILSLVPDNCKPPNKPNIIFLCDFIDCLYVVGGWDEAKIGEFVGRVEKFQDSHGLDRDGVSKKVKAGK